MPVNITKIIDQVNLLSANTLTIEQATQFKHIADNLGNMGNIYANTSVFPAANTNTGRYIFCTADGFMYTSDGTAWYSAVTAPQILTTQLKRLWTWGGNGYGQLGDGTTTSRSSPGTTAGGGTNWSQVSCGLRYALSVKTDGTLWGWGKNDFYGNIGDGTNTNKSSPVTTAGGGTTWSQVAAGSTTTYAIKTDGTLWAWGEGTYGALGDGTAALSRSSPVTTAGGGTNWSSVASGDLYGVAIKTDGTLWTWGYNNDGQLGTGNTTARSSPGTTAGGGTTWSKASAGNARTTAAIKTDGTLWTWGRNGYGSLGNGTTTSRSSPGTTAGGGTNWSQVSVGLDSIAAIKTDGTLWTWGFNNAGQLGDGTNTDRSSPGTTAGGGTTWSQVAAGTYSTAAIKTDGKLWTWGRGNNGQLARTGDTTSPVSISGGGSIFWLNVSTSEIFMAAVGDTTYS